MPRITKVWLALTGTAAVALAVVAVLRSESEAATWIVCGIVLSLVTILSSLATVVALGVQDKPLPQLLTQTSVRMALPLAVLLALAIVRRDVLTPIFLLYFLPFQFITLTADALGAIKRVEDG